MLTGSTHLYFIVTPFDTTFLYNILVTQHRQTQLMSDTFLQQQSVDGEPQNQLSSIRGSLPKYHIPVFFTESYWSLRHIELLYGEGDTLLEEMWMVDITSILWNSIIIWFLFWSCSILKLIGRLL